MSDEKYASPLGPVNRGKKPYFTMILAWRKSHREHILLGDSLFMWHKLAQKEIRGLNVDLGFVSLLCARANQTKVNIWSP